MATHAKLRLVYIIPSRYYNTNITNITYYIAITYDTKITYIEVPNNLIASTSLLVNKQMKLKINIESYHGVYHQGKSQISPTIPPRYTIIIDTHTHTLSLSLYHSTVV